MKHKNQHSLNRLKKLVEDRFGSVVASRPDCERLAHEIYHQTGQLISYNTLRRVFQLAGEKNQAYPTVTTLNILANYCGYKNYYQVALGVEKQDLSLEELYATLTGFHLLEQIPTEKVTALFNQHSISSELYFFYYHIINQAFLKQDKKFILSLFENHTLFDNNHYLFTHIYFTMLSAGLCLRNIPFKQEVWNAWAINPRAQSFYFELFVDMDRLVLDHYRAIEAYRTHKKTTEATMFSSSLLFLKAFMNNDKAVQKKELTRLHQQTIHEEIHPIPIARMLNCLMLHEKDTAGKISEKTKKQVLDLNKKIRHYGTEGKFTSFFQFWILEGLVMVGEYKLAEQIIHSVEKHGKEDKSYYNIGSWERYKMYKALTLFHRGNLATASKLATTIHPERFHAFSALYDRIFYFTLMYKTTGEKTYLEQSLQLSRELGYEKLHNLLHA